MKRPTPQHLLAVVAVVLLLAAFVAPPGAGTSDGIAAPFAWADRHFSSWFGILAVFAFLLGGISLVRSHGRRVLERGADWGYSAVTLVAFAVVLVVGMFKLGGAPGLTGDPTAADSWLTKVFEAVLSPLHATMYSLLAFYVASASYRAFRAHGVETAVLLIAALAVLVGRLPAAVIPLRLEDLGLWILTVPNTAGQRALMIGIALGVAALAVRMVMGLERGRGGDGS